MRTNKTKAKLRDGQLTLGAMMQFHSPEIVEILGAVGFDYVVFDLEHEPYSEISVVDSIRAAEAFDITPIVRVHNDPEKILRFLDAGAQGIHVPRINSAEDAAVVVRSARFHPQGRRTFYATGRSGNYGVGMTEEQFAETCNQETLVILQVEEMEGIDNLERILAVPHIDAIQIGPKDLWQSMGMPDRSVVWKIVEEALSQTVQSGHWTSMVAWMSSDVKSGLTHYRDLGVRMFTILPREILTQGLQTFIEETVGAIGPLIRKT